MQHPWILPWMPLGASLHLGMPLGGLAIPCGLSPSAAAGYVTAPHGSTQASYHLVPTLHGVPTLVPHALPRHSTRPKVTEMGAAAGLISEGAGTPSEKRKAEEGDVSKEVKRAKIETRALKAKRPGFTEERYNETEYYIDNGLRKVHPYYFTFTTFTKGRWVGERILDIFAKEFRAHPVEEYERCIKAGTLTVNYMPVEVDYRLKHNDLLANIVHRHERPVIGDRIEIVHCDEDLVVVHKPPSVPVHPCGRYRHNTVVFILAKEHNLRNLRTIHRLDRLTSGLLLFGRTPKKAREMEQQIRTRQVLKEYVCRVEGQFPEEEIEVTEPIEVISYKIGVCKVSPKGKDCRTHFKKLTYDVTCNTSIVLARPHTGRMHQIRVHLQFLGYPIVNDPLYNHVVFGPEKGKQGQVGKSDDDLIKDLISIHNAENWLGGDGDDTGGGIGSGDLGALPLFDSTNMAAGNVTVAAGTPPATDTVNQKEVEAVPTEQKEENGSNEVIDPHCFECRVKFRDPRPEDLMMYLHAWRYQGPNWSFETKLPAWAGQDWSHPPPATFANAIASTSPPTSTSTTTR